MYRVMIAFADKEDKDRPYKVGEEYPRQGFKPSEARIGFLMSNKTTLGEPVIAEVKEEGGEKPKRAYTPRKSKENK